MTAQFFPANGGRPVVTFGPSPARVAKAIERHIRNSHAIGRLIVDGVLTRVSGKPSAAMSSSPVDPEPPTPPTIETMLGNVDLPRSEDEWKLLSSGDVVKIIDACDEATVRAIGRYEESHRRRRLVIEAVRRRLES